MKIRKIKKTLLFSITILIFFGADGYAQVAGWKAGVARTVITPDEPMWQAGYASRTQASEGQLHDLWAKALVMEDADGKRAVLVTTDLLGFPKGLSDRIRERLAAKYRLSKAQIILNSSHTHSGPVLQDALYDIYPLDAKQLTKVRKYTLRLENQIVDVVGQAINALEPVELSAQNGVTRFQVNRRNNSEAKLSLQTELKGPNDYAVPVIKVVNAKGDLKAVAFGYACHPTVLNGYKWSGDYPGFAQLELEKSHPGVTALFFQGAGGDQNPLPRRTVALAQQYGRELAAAVERVLAEDMPKLSPRLTTAYSEVNLPFASPPGRDELTKLTQAPGTADYEKRWASRMLEKMKRNEAFPITYPYPVQVWQLGNQPIISLGGEVVIDYAIKLKQLLGPSLFVMGYSNDVMGYIPSATILREGGYEGASSQMVYGLPGLWQPAIETTILQEVQKVARQAGVPIP